MDGSVTAIGHPCSAAPGFPTIARPGAVVYRGGERKGRGLTSVSYAAISLFVGPDEVAMAWMRDGLCRGESDLFFAPFAERPEARVRREAQARDLCSRCPSADPCRQYARDNRELGFWGAESEADRATAGFAPTTPIIGRRQVAAERAAAALAAAAGGS